MTRMVVVVSAILLGGACAPATASRSGTPGTTSTVRPAAPAPGVAIRPAESLTPTIPPTTYPGQRPRFRIPRVAPGGAAVIELPDTALHFAPGSSEPSASDVEALEALGRDIAALRPTKVTVAGHCDESGGPNYPQQALSEARANRVSEILRRAPLGPNVVLAVGYGNTRPLPPPAPPDANRRVVITIETGRS